MIRPRQELRDAFAAGQVSAEHVAVITTAVTALPDSVDPVVRIDAETALVQAATAHDPKTLAHIGTHLRHTLDDTGGADLADKRTTRSPPASCRSGCRTTAPRRSAATSTPSSPRPSAPNSPRWPHPSPPPTATATCAPRPNATPTPWPSCCAATPPPTCPPPATARRPPSPSR